MAGLQLRATINALGSRLGLRSSGSTMGGAAPAMKADAASSMYGYAGGSVVQTAGFGYAASRMVRRLAKWRADKRHVNDLLQRGGVQLLARSRDLCRENPYARNAKASFQAAVVGTGITPSPDFPDSLGVPDELSTQVRDAWEQFVDECDPEGLLDFYGIQNLVAGQLFEAGECFVRIRRRLPQDGLLIPFQLQVIESEQLDVGYNGIAPNGNEIRMGIEYGALGQRVAYHFWKYHPYDVGMNNGNAERTIVPATDILHVMMPTRPGQIRGEPMLTPAMVRLYLLDQYDDAELERKKVAALFSGFITKDLPEDNGTPLPQDPLTGKPVSVPMDDSFGTSVAVLEPGTLQVLYPGEDVKFSAPADLGNAYEDFQFRNLLAISAACGVPYITMTGDISAANYSSLRGGQVEFRKRVDQVQHLTLAVQLCARVWNLFWDEAVLGDVVPVRPAEYRRNMRAYRRSRWITPPWPEVDEMKSAQANKLKVDEGFIPRSDVQEASGYDAANQDRRIKISQDRKDEMKLRIGADNVPPALAEPPENDPQNQPGPRGTRGDRVRQQRSAA
jgi:lambda family phage portal protein